MDNNNILGGSAARGKISSGTTKRIDPASEILPRGYDEADTVGNCDDDGRCC